MPLDAPVTTAVRPVEIGHSGRPPSAASTRSSSTPPLAPVREADEVAEERRVRPLAALVRRHARELEQPVGLLGREAELGGVRRRLGGQPVARLLQPPVHRRNLSRTAALHSAKREDRRPEGDRRRGTAGRTRARHGRAPGRRRCGGRGRARSGRRGGLHGRRVQRGGRRARRRLGGRPRAQGAATRGPTRSRSSGRARRSSGCSSRSSNRDLAEALAARGVTSFSLDAIPRITRAQSMDALSSQATVAGYKAVRRGRRAAGASSSRC